MGPSQNIAGVTPGKPAGRWITAQNEKGIDMTNQTNQAEPLLEVKN